MAVVSHSYLAENFVNPMKKFIFLKLSSFNIAQSKITQNKLILIIFKNRDK